MAKDDYDVIVFKILMYYYGILKREYNFNCDVLKQKVGIIDIDEDYLVDILRSMQDEKLINGLTFAHAWGNTYILVGGINSMSEMGITHLGVEYLKDNSKMKEVKNLLLNASGAIAELISILAI